MNDLAAAVVVASLAAGGICFYIALFMLFYRGEEAKAVKQAARQLAEKSEKSAKSDDDASFRAQAGSMSSALEGVAALATALKDLDRVTQFVTLALGFFAIAGVTAGLDAIGNGL